MVANLVENDYQESNSLNKLFKNFTRSRIENSSSNSKLVTETGGMASIRGGSRAAVKPKIEHFVIIVNNFQPLTIITKCSILDVAAALDPPEYQLKFIFKRDMSEGHQPDLKYPKNRF